MKVSSFLAIISRLTSEAVGKGSGQRLSKLVYSAMKNDPLFPIFHYNVYLPSIGRFPKVSYRYQDFLEGVDIRLRELLLYVDECIETHGADKVLIDEPKSVFK